MSDRITAVNGSSRTSFVQSQRQSVTDRTAICGSSRTNFVQSQRQTVTDRPYNLQVQKNTMVGLTVDRSSGYATAGYESKKRVCLQNSTDRYAAYEILNKTFK